MSGDDKRNTVIVKLHHAGFGSIQHLQGKSNGQLVLICPSSLTADDCLLDNEWKTSAQVYAVLSENQHCTDGECPIHCETSSFTAWSPCSVTCGGGSRSRSRSVVTSPQFNGDVCPHLSFPPWRTSGVAHR